MSDQYAVFGNPIAQSKSPQIHRLFADQYGLDISYDRLQVAEGKFEQAARTFFEKGGRGLNVTTPFKDDAYQFANQLTPRARRAGAVNTLAVQEGGEVLGDTTDGVGVVRDICRNLKWNMRGKRVLILGAGGAVRGVLASVLEESPAVLVIANRTAAKAQSLAKGFIDLGPIEGIGLDNFGSREFDLIINGTSIHLAGGSLQLPETIFGKDCCCYDMAYASELTPFLRWVKPLCAESSDGLGMLVEQAAESFSLWTQKRPETASVIEVITELVRPDS